jgi:hypothetical protein
MLSRDVIAFGIPLLVAHLAIKTPPNRQNPRFLQQFLTITTQPLQVLPVTYLFLLQQLEGAEAVFPTAWPLSIPLRTHGIRKYPDTHGLGSAVLWGSMGITTLYC